MAQTAADILEQAKRREQSTLTAGAILEQAKQRNAQTKPRAEQNFLERVSQDFSRRGERFGEIGAAFEADEQGLSESLFQGAGTLAGGAFDVLGEGFVSAGRGLSAITPDVIEDRVVDSTKELAELFAEKADKSLMFAPVKKGIEEFPEFAEANPRVARNLEAAGNIALLAAPVKGSPKPGPLTTAGQSVVRSGRKTTIERRHEFIDDLVTPEQTKRALVEQVPRTAEEGILKTKVVELSPMQAASAQELRRVPGVTPKKTIQGNYLAISDAVSKEATKLKVALESLGERGTYLWNELGQVSEKISIQLKESPALVGDAAKSAGRVIEQAFRIAAGEEKTLAGLLATRKKLDAWVLKHKPKALEDGGAASAMTEAVRAVRGELNNFIAERAPSVAVKRSLASQTKMLNAMDDVVVKAAAEPGSIAARAIKTAIKVIPVRNELVAALGLMFGVGGLGAASMFLPVIQQGAILAGITVGTRKMVMSPKTRETLGELIKLMDKAVPKINDPRTLRQFRADRAALVEIIKTSEIGE